MDKSQKKPEQKRQDFFSSLTEMSDLSFWSEEKPKRKSVWEDTSAFDGFNFLLR